MPDRTTSSEESDTNNQFDWAPRQPAESVPVGESPKSGEARVQARRSLPPAHCTSATSTAARGRIRRAWATGSSPVAHRTTPPSRLTRPRTTRLRFTTANKLT
eukprot:2196205-Prymnesium_polylepis.1